jgi:hypothetical protein
MSTPQIARQPSFVAWFEPGLWRPFMRTCRPSLGEGHTEKAIRVFPYKGRVLCTVLIRQRVERSPTSRQLWRSAGPKLDPRRYPVALPGVRL